MPDISEKPNAQIKRPISKLILQHGINLVAASFNPAVTSGLGGVAAVWNAGGLTGNAIGLTGVGVYFFLHFWDGVKVIHPRARLIPRPFHRGALSATEAIGVGMSAASANFHPAVQEIYRRAGKEVTRGMKAVRELKGEDKAIFAQGLVQIGKDIAAAHHTGCWSVPVYILTASLIGNFVYVFRRKTDDDKSKSETKVPIKQMFSAAARQLTQAIKTPVSSGLAIARSVPLNPAFWWGQAQYQVAETSVSGLCFLASLVLTFVPDRYRPIAPVILLAAGNAVACGWHSMQDRPGAGVFFGDFSQQTVANALFTLCGLGIYGSSKWKRMKETRKEAGQESSAQLPIILPPERSAIERVRRDSRDNVDASNPLDSVSSLTPPSDHLRRLDA